MRDLKFAQVSKEVGFLIQIEKKRIIFMILSRREKQIGREDDIEEYELIGGHNDAL